MLTKMTSLIVWCDWHPSASWSYNPAEDEARCSEFGSRDADLFSDAFELPMNQFPLKSSKVFPFSKWVSKHNEMLLWALCLCQTLASCLFNVWESEKGSYWHLFLFLIFNSSTAAFLPQCFWERLQNFQTSWPGPKHLNPEILSLHYLSSHFLFMTEKV